MLCAFRAAFIALAIMADRAAWELRQRETGHPGPIPDVLTAFVVDQGRRINLHKSTPLFPKSRARRFA